jgi:hypothetical protein
MLRCRLLGHRWHQPKGAPVCRRCSFPILKRGWLDRLDAVIEEALDDLFR